MAKIEFYTVYSWMRDELNLSGTELDCYAVIYCLSQGDNEYIAGIKNLMQLLHKSEPTIIVSLKSLTEKGLVEKKPVVVNNATRYYYKAIKPSLKPTKEILGGTLNNLSGGTLNNLSRINNIKEENIKEKNNKRLSNDNQKVDYSEEFSLFWKVYHEGSKQQAYKAWKKLTDKEREAAEKNVYSYITFCRRSGRKKKDVSTYLNQKGFKEDWSQVPDCYRPVDGDIERVGRFKKYMVTKWPDLIYHRNPLTFEQCDRLIEDYGLKQFEWAMFRLCARDIHQYYSIKAGVETILKEEGDDDV